MPDAPEPRPRLSEQELRTALDEHRLWAESSGRDGTRANLSGFDLSGLHLEGECLAGAKLLDARLAGTNLIGADLSGAYLSNADLSGAELNLANLTNARLSDATLAGAELHHADLCGAYLERANLADADLRHANLSAADLHSANLAGADLHRAVLAGAALPRANLAGADLTNADLSHAELSLADLSGARLGAARLPGARLQRARLTGADLTNADLTDAQLFEADLSRARLKGARLENADLRCCRVHRLDESYVRGAQFSALSARWWVFLCTVVLGPLSLWLDRRGWKKAAGAVGYQPDHNDPWSVLRQSYAGPRVLFLFFTVLLFALPYVGRAAVYSVVGPVERELIRAAEVRKRQVERRLAESPDDPVLRDDLEHINQLLNRVERKPVWKVLLHWGHGNPWPSILAGVLILYNVGLYVLITCVSGLRDEEERSGWTPAWREYGYLIWIHRVVVLLFYVSVATFLYNIGELLGEEIAVPRFR